MEIKGFEDYSSKGTVWQNAVNPPEQFPIEDVSSPLISPQNFELCDPKLFQEPLQDSQVTSSPNCCYEDKFSYINKFTNLVDNSGTETTTTNANNNHSLSVTFHSPEEIENDFFRGSIDFSRSIQFSLPQFLTKQKDQFDMSLLQSQIPNTMINRLSNYPSDPIMRPPLPSLFEENCSTLMPPYARLNTTSNSHDFLEPTDTIGPYLPSNLSSTFSADNPGVFSRSLCVGNEWHGQELDFRGDNTCGSIFSPEPLPSIYNSNDLQKALDGESQNVVNGGGSTSPPLASDISSLGDPNFKVCKLSVEEKKEKIHKYLKKRTQRNFTKKIKYACRKTLAESRPRVKGRFAKKDELNLDETPRRRRNCSSHEEDTDEDVFVKEEGLMVDSSDIFAHISGLNSFKCNYPIQSWI